MIKKIKAIVPNPIYRILRLVRNRLCLCSSYCEDFKHLRVGSRKAAFRRETLEGDIAKEAHRIEKGLSMKDFREGFGNRALYGLTTALWDYRKRGYSTDNMRYRVGISVIQSYIARHQNSRVDVKYLEQFLEKLGVDRTEELGGCADYSQQDILKMVRSDFEQLCQARHSVRHFSPEKVDIEDVNHAIQIAMTTPSACNRQGWKVRVITDKGILEQFNEVHNGFANTNQNLTTLILVTSLNNYFTYPLERNQGFIDGGLFCMSLIYALTYKGLATCALNANLSKKGKRIIRQVLDVDVNENLIMFIAVGKYPETFRTPKSTRDPCHDKVLYY